MRIPDTRGLTKREYFAAIAMSGMAHGYSDAKQAAEMSVKYADELIKSVGGYLPH